VKLLLDENLARELVGRLADVFPGTQHVTSVGLERATDREVWDYAHAHGYAIASKDSDFNQLSFLHGAPPKVIWLMVLGKRLRLKLAKGLLDQIGGQLHRHLLRVVGPRTQRPRAEHMLRRGLPPSRWSIEQPTLAT
jgi:predicted nuclease of predicted toxin-antitoxin system